MRIAVILTMLMLSASLAGCFGDDEPHYPGGEGCTVDDAQDESCEAELPEENETIDEPVLDPPAPDLVYSSPDGVDLRLAL